MKTEIFPKSLGRRIVQAEEIRHASDYDDFYIATKEKAEEQIETAKELIEQIEMYVTIHGSGMRTSCAFCKNMIQE